MTAAMIAAVYPHMNHIGGDGFWLVREPSGRVRAFMAAGRAGSNARRELYREYETIPARGPLASGDASIPTQRSMAQRS